MLLREHDLMRMRGCDFTSACHAFMLVIYISSNKQFDAISVFSSKGIQLIPFHLTSYN